MPDQYVLVDKVAPHSTTATAATSSSSAAHFRRRRSHDPGPSRPGRSFSRRMIHAYVVAAAVAVLAGSLRLRTGRPDRRRRAARGDVCRSACLVA